MMKVILAKRTPTKMDSTNRKSVSVWVLAEQPDQGCLERLGDAARLAQAMHCRVGVGLVTTRSTRYKFDANLLIEHGADLVRVTRLFVDQVHSNYRVSQRAQVRASLELLEDQDAKVVFVGGSVGAREWGSLLAAQMDSDWISPVLTAHYRSHQVQIARLDLAGRRTCTINKDLQRPVIISMRDGVAETLPRSAKRSAVIEDILCQQPAETIQFTHIPVDPSRADIRDCKKLISGGRGLGSARGFDLLRRVAAQLDAGVAASRMAVDHGWIGYERQVGQTGKTVQPDLYIACGISGASHHLDGMSSAQHIVAINSDLDAPIMKVAHLKLAADLHSVLDRVSKKLQQRVRQGKEASS